MPLFMDMHQIAGGVAMEDVARAHLADLQVQAAHDVRYLRYWVDEGSGLVFCLIEAPSAQAAEDVHRQAHGLVADQIYRVQEGS
jgi:Nickel responsive protein SCO4226-like